jgi:hypothetical protein
MKIVNAIREWWIGPDPEQQEKDRMLKERMARLFGEAAIPSHSYCVDLHNTNADTSSLQ